MTGNPTSGLPSGIELRAYQPEALAGLRSAIARGHRLLVLQAPTGSGKTVMAAELIRGAERKGKKVLFLAHRRELIFQASAKLREFGVWHGLILAGEQELAAPTQVASIQTLSSKLSRGRPLPDADLVVIDECHRSLAKTYLSLIEKYRAMGAVVLGLTATPTRSDGKGLGDIYQDIVCCPTIRELTGQGFLVPVRYFAPSIPDLTGVHIRGGDYALDEASAVMDRPKLVGDVVENWLRIAPERKTVVFATAVAHSRHICEQFTSAGIKAEHIDGKTPKDERDNIIEDLRRGGIQVVSNCDVLTEGVDIPDVACGVIARPTKSLTRFLQMCGRFLRPAPGKDDAILIDHAGTLYEHGFLHEFGKWELSSSKQDSPNAVQRERKEVGAKPIVCERCTTVYVGEEHCPECGHKYQPKGKAVEFVDARLGEVTKVAPEAKAERHTEAEKEAFWRGLLAHQENQSYKRGWAWHCYREKFKKGPKRAWGERAGPINFEVRNYLKFRLIRHVRGRGKGGNVAGAGSGRS